MTSPPNSRNHEFLVTFERDLDHTASRFPLPSAGRDEMRSCLAAYRDIIECARARIQSVHEQGASGRTICELFGSLTDIIIRHFARQAFTPTHPDPGIAIAAMGGYGRNELNPFSDIDIMFLLRDDAEFVYESEIQHFLQFLWDVNLEIGHSTHTISECLDTAKHNLNLATSLLESRLLWGDPAVLAELKVSFQVWLQHGEGKTLALKKIDERKERLTQSGGTVNIQSPNVKESLGGLRDIHTVRWVMLFIGTGDSLEKLFDNSLVNSFEYEQYCTDFDFLLRVRNAIHFVARKKTDLLEHQSLPDIAGNLASPGSRKDRTEAFMRDYYRHAGSVFRLTNHIIGRFISTFDLPMTHDLEYDPSGLVIIDAKLGFAEKREATLSETPELIMKLYAFASLHGLEISGRAASVIERTLQEHRLDLASNPNVRETFREMIEARKNMGKVFREMHEHGVLTLLIPELENIHWHYQYNFYHAYTTDEHSIKVVENIEKIEQGKLATAPELTRIMDEVAAKGALYLAGLLHDVGKGKGVGHSLRGARFAAQAIKRLGYDDRTIYLVRVLIQEHLLMTHISQRRDMEDENTIKDFVRRIGNMGRLRMLAVLTFADLMAVSETSLTDWKKTLLLRLYNKAMMHFDRGFEKPYRKSASGLIKQILRVPRDGIDEHIVREHFEKLPEQYGHVTRTTDIRSHLAGIVRMRREGVWSSFHLQGEMTSLTVIAEDYTSALLDICGAITASDINIVAAQIFTCSDGVIIDTFHVVDGTGLPVIAPEVKREFKRNLTRVLSGEISAQDLIHTHVRRWRRRRKNMVPSPPRVNIHNDISEKYTVIDVFANDYTGLLYDILQVFASYGIDIYTAKIGTDEDQAVDAFYVRTKDGGKIEDPQKLADISDTIIRTLKNAPINIR